MGFRTRAATLVAIAATSLVLGACGGSSDSSGSPTSPSKQQAASSPTPDAGPAPSASSVRIQGAVGSLAGACPTVSFGVGSERVRTSSDTEFQRIACNQLRNGTLVEVDGSRQADGSVLAREVELDDEPPVPAPPVGNALEVEGLIQNLTGGCPDLSFMVASRRIRTTGATQFNRIPCARLQNGMDVEVDGVLDAAGVLVARQVQPDEVDVEGVVGALAGACPDRRFTVGGAPVIALATTRFDDTSCGTLREGLRVEVRGVRRPDGVLLLTRVKPREGNQGPNQEQRVEGSLADLRDACPARSFSISGQRVTTTAATRFDDTSCAGLQPGMRVEVRGFSLASGAIEATRVTRKN